ncbi:MAG: glycosyltransferase [Syntrophobacteraceae bacterium]
MNSSNPLISVIVPVYNGVDFLEDALASIRKQNYCPLEIVIIDDGSTDGTASLAATMGQDIHWIFQQNRGPSAARNAGLAVSHGGLIAFLDADDLWPPGKLHAQVELLFANPAVEIVLGRIKRIDYSGTPPIVAADSDGSLFGIHLGSALFRKAVFDKVGFFDEDLRYSEDHDWFFRAREQNTSIISIPRVTLLYRRHGKNMTMGEDAQGYQLPRVLKKSLDRRRSQNNGMATSLTNLTNFSALLGSNDTRSKDSDNQA